MKNRERGWSVANVRPIALYGRRASRDAWILLDLLETHCQTPHSIDLPPPYVGHLPMFLRIETLEGLWAWRFCSSEGEEQQA
jgi:hypothetical protein